MIIKNLITASMRKLGLIASGELPEPEDLADALEALQVMLRSWSTEKINLFATTSESVNLVGGTSLYTWGTGGSINSARPNQLVGAFIRDSSGTDHPVNIVSEKEYNAYSVKTTSSRPDSIFFKPAYPLASLYTYPAPQESEALHLISVKPFTETSSFDNTESILAMPGYYEEPIIYNLAVRIAPEYGKTVSIEVVAIASNSYQRLINLNFANSINPITITLPLGSNYNYDINCDS